MFILRKKDYPTLNETPEGEKLMRETNRILTDSSSGLSFDPEEHRYSFCGQEIKSVSSIIQQYDSFDAETIARRCSRNPNSSYYGQNPEAIVALWKENNRKSTDAGSQIHAFAESCLLFLTGKEAEIEEQFRDRITPQGLAALSPKEEAAARWWDNLDMRTYVVIAKETMLFNPILRYAGTFDLLLYNTRTGMFLLKDYKTNKNIWKDKDTTKYLKGAFNRIVKDSEIGKYTIQQNMYGIVLQSIGLPLESRSLIWLKEDCTYEEIELPEREKIIQFELTYNNPQI